MVGDLAERCDYDGALAWAFARTLLYENVERGR
jgi:hypothetical protein